MGLVSFDSLVTIPEDLKPDSSTAIYDRRTEEFLSWDVLPYRGNSVYDMDSGGPFC